MFFHVPDTSNDLIFSKSNLPISFPLVQHAASWIYRSSDFRLEVTENNIFNEHTYQ